jgi:hypothetical protein
MNASPFVKPFAERAAAWETMLQTLQDMLDNWLTCQATWLYLEPIFSSDDIVKQMPGEGEKFRSVGSVSGSSSVRVRGGVFHHHHGMNSRYDMADSLQ